MSGLIREVASLTGDKLVVVYYCSASEFWPKRGGLIRGRELLRNILGHRFSYA
jgi:hypothetical protein